MLKYLKKCNKNCFKESNSTEETGDLISNKIADKIINASKELHSKTDEN